ncbi:hypothetical protein CO038_03265 [Candidatus Pacearchaeota archaeon CG_4_9_14_0_2_um_filter_39_13]|nr:MAG: hypothetical protein CO038_03265 [Candidatus Pacearchaeota archaeon CG_4_9_14_0_2_um_filter_39_13]
MHWNRLPDVNKIAQLKSLVRFTAPYNGRDDRGTKCNWKNMDVVILEHVKKRLTDRDNTEPSFLRVYRAFQKYFDYHNELPDAGYIIGKMLPELASPEAREVDSELRRHELSYGRTLESQRKMRGIINRKLS